MLCLLYLFIRKIELPYNYASLKLLYQDQIAKRPIFPLKYVEGIHASKKSVI